MGLLKIRGMEELEKQLVEILKKAMEAAEKGGEFVLDVAPELLNEFYAWHISKSVIWILMGISVFLILRFISNLFGCKEEFEYMKNYPYNKDLTKSKIRNGRHFKEGDDSYIASLIVRLSGIFIFWIILCVNIYDICFILIAPKLYLIEYFVK